MNVSTSEWLFSILAADVPRQYLPVAVLFASVAAFDPYFSRTCVTSRSWELALRSLEDQAVSVRDFPQLFTEFVGTGFVEMTPHGDFFLSVPEV